MNGRLLSKCTARLASVRKVMVLAPLGAFAVFFLLAAAAAQNISSREVLWQVVNAMCIPDQVLNQNPAPCVRVDLQGGTERGFAILKDQNGATQYLLVPTVRISGIESPLVLAPGAPNYFATAWEARTYVNDALHRTLPRDDLSLAVNSAMSRSQDSLHIHIDCVRSDVAEALHKYQDQIGSQWAPFPPSFFGHHYLAMWVPGEKLDANPFRLLADRLPGARQDMGDHTLVVVGLTRRDGTKGFVLLEDQVDKPADMAGGEELQDHTCGIAR